MSEPYLSNGRSQQST